MVKREGTIHVHRCLIPGKEITLAKDFLHRTLSQLKSFNPLSNQQASPCWVGLTDNCDTAPRAPTVPTSSLIKAGPGSDVEPSLTQASESPGCKIRRCGPQPRLSQMTQNCWESLNVSSFETRRMIIVGNQVENHQSEVEFEDHVVVTSPTGMRKGWGGDMGAEAVS